MQVNLSAAWESYRRGEFERAARLGEVALTHDPDQPDALHLVGLVALRARRSSAGRALIGHAVAARPSQANYHASLAEAWSGSRTARPRRRLLSRAACRLKPDRPEYHYNPRIVADVPRRCRRRDQPPGAEPSG